MLSPDAESLLSGEHLEREVARIYALLGAEIQQRLIVEHHEIDVHAIFRKGPFPMAYIVECKEYAPRRAITNAQMLTFSAKLDVARSRGIADKGVFVTTSKFTKNAKATAAAKGIQCITLRELYNQLIDFQPYLKSVVRAFDESTLGRWYVDQTVSELEDYDALASADLAKVLHSPALEYLNDLIFSAPTHQIALLGNFGTGKTSLCVAFQAQLARKALVDPAARIPILIDLREFRAGLDIQQILVNTLQRLPGVDAGMQLCLELQRMGRFILLLDGLDEMATRVDRAVVHESLRELGRLRLEGKNCYIVTCRTHFFQERILDVFLDDYRVLYLTEWRGPELRSYFHKRFNDRGADIYQRIQANPRIAELARTPLLLDILLQTEDFNAPEMNVYGLLSRYTGEWISKQSKRRGTVMSPIQRRQFVVSLAYHMHARSVPKLHYSDLYEISREFSGHRDASSIDHFDADARTCTFITRDSLGNYSFRYETFFDYFTATAIADRIEAGERAAIADREITPEVMELLAERRLLPEACVHLRNWSTEFDAERLSRNAFRLLMALGEELPVEVKQQYNVTEDDRQLLRGRDENRSFAQLYESIEKYEKALRKRAKLWARQFPDVEADDAIHDTLLSAFLAVQKRRLIPGNIMNLEQYLLGMLYRAMADRQRAIRHGRAVSVEDPKVKSEVELALRVDDSHSAAFEHDVAMIVGRLPPPQREAIVLQSKGMTSSEIAEVMRLSPHTVKAYLRSALSNLRSMIST